MDRTAVVEHYLRQLINDAELDISGRNSVLDFAARIRRDTAQDILKYLQSLSAQQCRKSTDRAEAQSMNAVITPLPSRTRNAASSATVQ